MIQELAWSSVSYRPHHSPLGDPEPEGEGEAVGGSNSATNPSDDQMVGFGSITTRATLGKEEKKGESGVGKKDGRWGKMSRGENEGNEKQR